MNNQNIIEKIANDFSKEAGFNIEPEVINRLDAILVIFRIINPTKRFYEIAEKLSESNEGYLVTIKKSKETDLIGSREASFLLRTLSESINVNRYTFSGDFLQRYVKSIFDAEDRIVANSNHIVFGRRGSGKSSLLLYALKNRDIQQKVSLWIDMQVYSKRKDLGLYIDIISELLKSIEKFDSHVEGSNELKDILKKIDWEKELDSLDFSKIRTIAPLVKQVFESVVRENGEIFIFIDDLHVLPKEVQPKLLDIIYSCTRGTNAFLKISAIEALTQTWDVENNDGIQIPHDVQKVDLDYNLTIQDKAAKHVEQILDKHAQYCGLPIIRKITTSKDFLPRLVWMSAGVPRDAVNIFISAFSKSRALGRKSLSLTDLNAASSSLLNDKIRDLGLDYGENASEMKDFIGQIEKYLIKKLRCNAFLVEIKVDDMFYEKIIKLVNLRMLHIIHEGISVWEAGKKHVAVILDYGFYVGARTARSVSLFNKTASKVSYKDLRALPIIKESDFAEDM